MQAFIGENQENAWVGLGTEDYAQFQRSVIAHVWHSCGNDSTAYCFGTVGI